MAVILSVEDNPINQLMLTERLSMYDHTILQAFDGEEAIEKLNQHNNIELILLDIGLPKSDGLTVAKQIKSNLATAQIPIFFLTAHATQEYKDKAHQLGGAEFFTKPIDFKLLIKTIDQLFS